MTVRHGHCLCGDIRYRVVGEPSVVGICHCSDCRRESGSMFVTYAQWPREGLSVQGNFATFEGRSFCPKCGSRLFNLTETKAELRIGSPDATPSGLVPGREVWCRRREPWIAPLPGIDQYDGDEPVPPVRQNQAQQKKWRVWIPLGRQREHTVSPNMKRPPELPPAVLLFQS